MKVTIKSNDPEEITRLTKSLDLAGALWDITHDNVMEDWVEQNPKATPYDVLDRFFKFINACMAEHGINLDDMYS